MLPAAVEGKEAGAGEDGTLGTTGTGASSKALDSMTGAAGAGTSSKALDSKTGADRAGTSSKALDSKTGAAGAGTSSNALDSMTGAAGAGTSSNALDSKTGVAGAWSSASGAAREKAFVISAISPRVTLAKRLLISCTLSMMLYRGTPRCRANSLSWQRRMAESDSLENPNAPITSFVKTSQSSPKTAPSELFCQGSLMHQFQRSQLFRRWLVRHPCKPAGRVSKH